MAKAKPHPSYDIANNTYTLKRQNGWKTEIGNSQVTNRFSPHFKVSKWLDEAFFGINFPNGWFGGGDNIEHDGEKIIWTRGIFELRFYDVPSDGANGAYEYEFVLNGDPPTNFITVGLDRQNVTLKYQPALTAEEIAEGATRPDRVVGSYAVYHTTKRNNEYKTGKVGHLYRPFAEDALGRTTWCSYNDDAQTTDQLTITIPQAFLDAAETDNAYPIVIDPLFGYDTEGGTTIAVSNIRSLANGDTGLMHTATTGDTVTELHGYISRTTAGVMNIGVYDWDGTEPDNLLIAADVTATSSSITDESTSVSQAMANGVQYTMAFTERSGICQCTFDSGSVGNKRDFITGGTGLADPWGGNGSDPARDYGFWAVYTTGGGPPARRVMVVT